MVKLGLGEVGRGKWLGEERKGGEAARKKGKKKASVQRRVRQEEREDVSLN